MLPAGRRGYLRMRIPRKSGMTVITGMLVMDRCRQVGRVYLKREDLPARMGLAEFQAMAIEAIIITGQR
jgi:hypothetical protein